MDTGECDELVLVAHCTEFALELVDGAADGLVDTLSRAVEAFGRALAGDEGSVVLVVVAGDMRQRRVRTRVRGCCGWATRCFRGGSVQGGL